MPSQLFAALSYPLIVFDLEWNQRYGKQQDGLPQEIVEIGAVKLDASLQIVDQIDLPVRPAVHKVMHHHVKRITGISTSQSKKGLPFVEAAARFFAFCGDSFTLCTWGRDDLPVLWKNLSYWALPLPAFSQVINLQKAYDQLFSPTPSQQTALSGAMEALAVTSELPAHRALHDALFTAQVLQGMDQRLQTAPATPSQLAQLHNAFTDELLRLSERKAVHLTQCRRLSEVLRDETLTACTCPLCEQQAAAEIPFYQMGRSQRFQQLSHCAEHGDILTQFQVQRMRTGFYQVLKRSRLTTPEGADRVRKQALMQPSGRRKHRKRKPMPVAEETGE